MASNHILINLEYINKKKLVTQFKFIQFYFENWIKNCEMCFMRDNSRINVLS